MRLDSLKPNAGSIKKKKRVGRGLGSGHGVTATRGTKGQKSRSGGSKGPHFEGGQNPFYLRLPRYPGFKNPFKKVYAEVNLDKLNLFPDEAVVDREALIAKNLIKKNEKLVKILGRGKLEKKLTVRANAFSKKATEEIKARGGKVELVND